MPRLSNSLKRAKKFLKKLKKSVFNFSELQGVAIMLSCAITVATKFPLKCVDYQKRFSAKK